MPPSHTSPPNRAPRPHRRATGAVAWVLALLVLGVGGFAITERAFERRIVLGQAVSVPAAHGTPFRSERDLAIERIDVLAVHDGRLYGMEDHFLYVSDDFGETFQQRGTLPKADPTLRIRLQDRIARHPLVRRIRNGSRPNNLVVLSSGTILVFYDRVYRSEDGGWTFEALHTPIDDLYGPTRNAVAVDGNDRVAFGEYLAAERPQTIRVAMGTNDGRDWRVCHTFEEGQVFHVHSVSYDPFADRLLVATGDTDAESGLWELDPDCRGVELVGGGDQRWRLLAPIFTEDLVLWGSDDDRDGADVWLKPRGSTELTHALHLGRPAYYATRLMDGTFVITTAFEPDSRFTRQHDPPRAGEVWVSRDAQDWFLLDRFEWVEEEHWWGRSRAVVRPPSGDASSPYLFVAPVSTEDGFVTYRYRIEWPDEGRDG